MIKLEESIREDTILVSCMMVNNEIGAIEPIEEIAKDHQSKESEYDFPCRCDSGIWKTSDRSKEYGIDLLSTKWS